MAVNTYLYDKMVQSLGFEPTPCQNSLFERLSLFVSGNSSADILLVNGYAGTGKTSAIGAMVAVLKELGTKVILLAPTGRAAKVLQSYTGSKTFTIHKHIYRQKSLKDGLGQFTLDVNKSRDAVFVVDEASLISGNSVDASVFGSGNLLDDFIEFVRSNEGNRIVFVGDSAQLPPVGKSLSDALDISFLSSYGGVDFATLTSVVRQERESGILSNATMLRNMISAGVGNFPSFNLNGFDDICSIGGGELLEALQESYDKYGEDEVIVLCRSNKRANRYNKGIRGSILFREESITRDDKIMVVKNCYQFLEEESGVDFIANGDVAEVVKISGHEERYGLRFAEAVLRFIDYSDIEIKAKVILDTLESEGASLGSEEQRRLFMEIFEDYSHIKTKRKRLMAVREDKYFNALQLKFAWAITCHKSQGGQWKVVFIDNSFWGDSMSVEDLRWLYTAVTRASLKLYFVNFDKRFFEK